MITTLSPEVKAKLNRLVQETVQFHREVETLKEDIKNNAEICNEEFGIPKKAFNQLVKAALDKAKLLEQIEELETTINNFESLTAE